MHSINCPVSLNIFCCFLYSLFSVFSKQPFNKDIFSTAINLHVVIKMKYSKIIISIVYGKTVVLTQYRSSKVASSH